MEFLKNIFQGPTNLKVLILIDFWQGLTDPKTKILKNIFFKDPQITKREFFKEYFPIAL